MSDGRPRSDVLAVLGTFVSRLSYADLPPSLRERAKLTLRHNLVVALAARRERMPGQDRVIWPRGLPAEQSATRFTDGLRAPAECAIVTNALAMGARAQHDEHPGAISHFGSAVLPALFAVAEQADVDGAAVLTAMVAGYEVGARIGVASVQETSRRGFRPTGLYGPFAAAAAAGRAMGLPADSLTSSLAFAANASSGLTQTWLRGTDEWRYQTAFAARNGYAAAILASQGARGAADTLEGENGFNRAFVATPVDAESILADLGERWMFEDILLKPYPICAFNQAAVQQVLALKLEHQINPRDIREVRVHMNPEDIRYPGVDSVERVDTRTAALMCARTCVAIALLYDDVSIEKLSSPSADGVTRLADRIDLVADPAVSSHAASLEINYGTDTIVSSGPPRETVYDKDVSQTLVSRLQPLTGLNDRQMNDLMNGIDSLDLKPNLDHILELVRESGGASD